MSEPITTQHSPAEKLNFLDTLYDTLFHPIATFRALDEAAPVQPQPLFYALTAVIAISALAPVIQMANVGGDTGGLALGIPLSSIAGVAIWAFMGLTTGLLAYAFTGQAKIRTFLTLSGLATLPWLLMGPVSVLKFGLGPIGAVIAILGALLVWLWSVLLFGLALMVTYRMTVERAMIVLATPFITLLILLGWILGFFGNVRQLVFHL
ncbi:YIP1 family protein [Vampirovibrio sp.]|uniref:YIP1 family protein n=1 Tax=Vampirovibrio sp. TaxID=2717857 RepID=UPI0035947B50